MDFPKQHIAMADRVIPLHYLCGYRAASSGHDGISKSILKFKQGDTLHIAAWAEVALLALQQAGLGKGDIMVRALGHQETAVLWRSDPQPMDVLCRFIAEKSGCAYSPDIIRKKWKTEKLRGMSRTQRERAMDGAYELAPVFGWGKQRLWIMDDVVTTGSTVRAIAAALLKRYPAVELRTFCLARTDGHLGDLERGLVKGEHYGWDARAGNWVVMEDPPLYGDEWLPNADNLYCPRFGDDGTWLVSNL